MKRCVLTLVLMSFAAVLYAQTPEMLSLDLYFELESVSNPRIAPDGSEIVYTRGWIDKMNDRRESSLSVRPLP